MFVEQEKVIYKEMEGIVDFIGSSYVVIELTPKPNFNPARLIVYSENFKNIIRCDYTSK